MVSFQRSVDNDLRVCSEPHGTSGEHAEGCAAKRGHNLSNGSRSRGRWFASCVFATISSLCHASCSRPSLFGQTIVWARAWSTSPTRLRHGCGSFLSEHSCPSSAPSDEFKRASIMLPHFLHWVDASCDARFLEDSVRGCLGC